MCCSRNGKSISSDLCIILLFSKLTLQLSSFFMIVHHLSPGNVIWIKCLFENQPGLESLLGGKNGIIYRPQWRLAISEESVSLREFWFPLQLDLNLVVCREVNCSKESRTKILQLKNNLSIPIRKKNFNFPKNISFRKKMIYPSTSAAYSIC